MSEPCNRMLTRERGLGEGGDGTGRGTGTGMQICKDNETCFPGADPGNALVHSVALR